MKNLIIRIFSIGTSFIFLLFVSCQNQSKQENHEISTIADSMSHHEEGEQVSPVSLNNGQKWDANPETTHGIQNMVQLVNDFPATTATQDYLSLKENLEAEFNSILQQCTMKGEAHEQLHNYLMPMSGLFNNLISNDEVTQRNALNMLKEHLAEYGNYFQ